jgi:hypothetical protein
VAYRGGGLRQIRKKSWNTASFLLRVRGSTITKLTGVYKFNDYVHKDLNFDLP